MENLEQQNLEQQSESGEQTLNDAKSYIKAINDMKKNSVPREKYEELQRENQELFKAVIEGAEYDNQPKLSSKERNERISELRKELYSQESIDKGMLNLEYVEKTLELRDLLIESGEDDPFLPIGRGVEITREDYEAAEFTAQQFRECIEKAEGDSAVFTAELMRRTIDNNIGPQKTLKTNRYQRR